MAITQDSPAVAVALAHVKAWTNHDYDAARLSLADDVTVTVTTTMPGAPKTDLVGIDDYMAGLKEFGQIVVPGSLEVVSSVGDDRNALLMLTVRSEGGPFGNGVLPGARLYLLDAEHKIAAEQVIFFMSAD